MTNRLDIVDLYSLVFQVYHALPAMSSPQGQPTGAVFGFTRDMLRLMQQKQTTHLICALDSSEPAVRNEISADYKATRGEMPEDLHPQIPLIMEILEAMEIPVLSWPGWEADDVFATLGRQAAEAGFGVRIVTSDKDARQLIGPRVQLYDVRKDRFLDEAGLEKEWGIRPEQVPDFQALVGDPVDNVPGVPLVGPKKARALLEQFGTLEEVLAHAEQAPGAKLRSNLKTYADQARLSRRLVTLNADLPLSIDWETARLKQPDRKRLLPLFRQLGFRQLIDQLGPAEQDDPPSRRQWEVIDTEEKFAAFLEELEQQSRFCLDLETTSLFPMQAEIVGWAVCWQPHHAYYIPVDGPGDQRRLDSATVLEAFRPLLEDQQISVVNQNIKYDMLVLRRAGVQVRGVGMDPMVGDYLLDAGTRTHNLDALAERYLNYPMSPISQLIGTGKNQKSMAEVDIDRVAEYASEDADIALQLAEQIGTALQRENLHTLYWDLERRLIPVLAGMEYTGIRVDVDELARQSAEAGRRLDQLVEEIYGLAGREFNIASPIQLRTILFEELHLPVLKRTKTGPSTSHDVLERLAAVHPLPATLIEHRQLSKLRGTYLDAIPELIHPETGKIHASFNQVVTATGRLSSSEPNLQNIPIRTEAGRRIRKAFVPSEPGWKLLCADYSQVELRLLAHFSEDPNLAAAFREGTDIHAAVASEIFGVQPEEVDSDRRRVAKAVNFGIVYGQSPFGLSATLGISQEQAAEFIENYFARYREVERFLERLLAECAECGYAKTILGRRRAITGIRNIMGHQRNLAERTAINTVIQGSAADLIKRAMIAVDERLQSENHPARMLLQIHDELIFEAPAEAIDSLVPAVRAEMESALSLNVPLEVDLSVGENWHDVQPVGA